MDQVIYGGSLISYGLIILTIGLNFLISDCVMMVALPDEKPQSQRTICIHKTPTRMDRRTAIISFFICMRP